MGRELKSDHMLSANSISKINANLGKPRHKTNNTSASTSLMLQFVLKTSSLGYLQNKILWFILWMITPNIFPVQNYQHPHSLMLITSGSLCNIGRAQFIRETKAIIYSMGFGRQGWKHTFCFATSKNRPYIIFIPFSRREIKHGLPWMFSAMVLYRHYSELWQCRPISWDILLDTPADCTDVFQQIPFTGVCWKPMRGPGSTAIDIIANIGQLLRNQTQTEASMAGLSQNFPSSANVFTACDRTWRRQCHWSLVTPLNKAST